MDGTESSPFASSHSTWNVDVLGLPSQTGGRADMLGSSLPSPLPARSAWAMGPRPRVDNNIVETGTQMDSRITVNHIDPFAARASNRSADLGRADDEVGDPTCFGGRFGFLPAHHPENHSHPKKELPLHPHHRSMLRECFSECTSSAYSGPPSISARDMSDMDSIAEENGDEFGACDTLFITASRFMTTSKYPTPDGTMVNFPVYAANQLLYCSNPEDIQAVLSDLLDFTLKREINAEWITGLALHPPFLKAVFRLMDVVVPATKVLSEKSVCARVLEVTLKKFPARFILHQVLGPSAPIDGTVGMRYLIRKGGLRSETIKSPIPGVEVSAARVVQHASSVIHTTSLTSAASVQAIRLADSVLHQVVSLEELHDTPILQFTKDIIVLLKKKNLRRPGERSDVDPARRIAAFNFISTLLRTFKWLGERLYEEQETPRLPHQNWLLGGLNVGDVLKYLEDEEGDPMVRCMALRVIRDLATVHFDMVPHWERLSDVVRICVDVLLWKTEWQHGQVSRAKSLEIVRFNSLDDAYQIISLSPPATAIAAMSRSFAVDDRYSLVEPLLDMVVDHFKAQDGRWPLMLSTMIQSGLLGFLQDALLQPFTQEGDSLDRLSCRAKADACVCLTRCLEQVKAKDLRAIPSNIGDTLANLAKNEDLPTNLREFAMDAIHALNNNTVPSLTQFPGGATHLDTAANSTSTSPRPDTNITGGDQTGDY